MEERKDEIIYKKEYVVHVDHLEKAVVGLARSALESSNLYASLRLKYYRNNVFYNVITFTHSAWYH